MLILLTKYYKNMIVLLVYVINKMETKFTVFVGIYFQHFIFDK